MGIGKEKIWKFLALVGTGNLALKAAGYLYDYRYNCIKLEEFKSGNVLVTDCTDGLSIEICKEISQINKNFVVLASSLKDFEEFRGQVQEFRPDTECIWVQFDLSQTHKKFTSCHDELTKLLENIEISIVVHGKSQNIQSFLTSQNDEIIEKIISENTYPVTLINHIILNKIIQSPFSNGLIITLSNSIDESIFPGTSTFAASQRYKTFLSEGLKYEYDRVKFALVKLDPELAFVAEGKSKFCVNQRELAASLIRNLKNGQNYPQFRFRSLFYFSRLFPYMPTIFLTRLVMPWYVKSKVIV